MRKCKGKYYKNGKIEEFTLGYFHQWGCDYEEGETNYGNFTVAIVELPDGTIVQPLPGAIQFLDKPEG